MSVHHAVSAPNQPKSFKTGLGGSHLDSASAAESASAPARQAHSWRLLSQDAPDLLDVQSKRLSDVVFAHAVSSERSDALLELLAIQYL